MVVLKLLHLLVTCLEVVVLVRERHGGSLGELLLVALVLLLGDLGLRGEQGRGLDKGEGVVATEERQPSS